MPKLVKMNWNWIFFWHKNQYRILSYNQISIVKCQRQPVCVWGKFDYKGKQELPFGRWKKSGSFILKASIIWSNNWKGLWFIIGKLEPCVAVGLCLYYAYITRPQAQQVDFLLSHIVSNVVYRLSTRNIMPIIFLAKGLTWAVSMAMGGLTWHGCSIWGTWKHSVL